MKDIRLIGIKKIQESQYSCRCIDRSPPLYKYEVAWKNSSGELGDAYCRRCGEGLFTSSEFKVGFNGLKASRHPYITRHQ